MSIIDDAVAKYETLAAGELTTALAAKCASKLAAIEAVVSPTEIVQPDIEWHKIDGATHVWPGPVDTAQWVARDDWLDLFTDLYSGWYRAGEAATLAAAGVRATYLSQTWQWGNNAVVVGQMVDDGWDAGECWKAIPGSPGYYYPAVWNGELAERCLLRWADGLALLIPIVPDLYRVDLDAEVACSLWTTAVGTALGITADDCNLLWWATAARNMMDAMGLSHVKLSTNPAALVLPTVHDICVGWHLIAGHEPSYVDSLIDAAQVIIGDANVPIVFGPHSVVYSGGAYRFYTENEIRPYLEAARLQGVVGFATWGYSWYNQTTGEPYDGFEDFVAFLRAYQAEFVPGPFTFGETEVFCPGAISGEVFCPGAVEAEVFCPGAVAGEVTRV